MKKIATAISLFLIVFSGVLSAQGIDFKHVTVEEALKQAIEEDKLVFIDFYTVWCGPCKVLSKTVFTQEKVGQLYNREFINIKLDAEKEGRTAAKKYKVDAYPTLVFLNGKGELVYKRVGSGDIASVLQLGKNALEAYSSGFSISQLKEAYAQKKDDERFLKMFISKMIEVEEKPIEAIEAWLQIQTEIKEDDVDMMEFLLDHAKYLCAGGKAEEILYANFDEYWDIATKAEESKLEKLKKQLVHNLYNEAIQNKEKEKMRFFISKWKQLPESKENPENLKKYEMTYLLLAKDYETYKKQATAYLDSIATAKTLEELRIDDMAAYEEYKTTEYYPSYISNIRLKIYEKGIEANKQITSFSKTIPYILKYCSLSKKDYKKLNAWMDYGSKLIPSDYRMDNLRASMLYKQGKTKDAIAYKESALSKVSEKSKEYPSLKEQLEKMKNGEEL